MPDNDNLIIQLIQRSRLGDQEAFSELVKQYQPLIRAAALKFSESGLLDYDDLRQEAAIALFGAVRTYKFENTNVTFGLYAKICIRNRMIELLRRSETGIVENHELTEDIEETENDPEKRAITDESFNLLLDNIDKSLTPLEKSIFGLYISGKSYREIAESLKKPTKSVDNAICRIKAKIRKLI